MQTENPEGDDAAGLNQRLLQLVETCSALLSSPEDGSVVHKIVDVARRFGSADAYALWRRPEGGSTWRVHFSAGLTEAFGAEAQETPASPMRPCPLAFEDVYAEARLERRWPHYRAEGIQSMLAIPLRLHGSLSGTLVFYHRARHTFTETETSIAAALGNLAAAALNIADVYEEQLRLRAVTDQAAERSSFLARAGAILASSLDVEQTLRSIAELAVPTIADWCAVDLVDNGKVRRVVVKHVDPAKVEVAREMYRRYPPESRPQFFETLESGECVLVPNLTDEMLVAGAIDQEQLRMVRELGLRSYVYAPLMVHGRALGMLVVVTAESGRRFGADDLPFLRELAQRAAFAVHSAHLHQAVSQSAARLRLATGAADLGICEWDVEQGAVIWENQRTYDIFGRTREQGPFSLPEFLGEVLHADDAHAVTETVRTNMREGAQIQLVFRILRHGETRWVETAGVFEKAPNSQSLRLITVIADVTEKKRADDQLRESEARLRFALQSAELGSWELDVQSGEAHRSFEHDKIFGYTEPVLEWSYPRFVGHVIGEDREAVDRQIKEAAAQKSDFNFEARIRRVDGEVRWIWVRARYIEQAGRPGRFIGIVSDITDRKRVDERLRETAKLESIGVLAGGVAHDFNNLLTGILGNASLALYDLDENHAAHRLLGEVVKAAERAAGLTRQLLAYSGRGKFTHQQIDLSDLTAETVKLIGALIPPSVQLNLQLAKALPVMEGDPVQIQQVAMNLIINAAESLGGAAGKVDVITEECDLDEQAIDGLDAAFEVRPGRYVCLLVQDTGCGMDAVTLTRIFDPFFTTKFTGRGLGLSAVLGIVRGHKGSLKVTSQPGAGTKFKVLWPMTGSKTQALADARAAPPFRGRGTVLLVDDEEVIRQTLRAMLERLGYRVLTANNGEQAIDIFRESAREIDLVFLDMSMPVMDGGAALPALQAIRPDVKIILSTGFGETDELSRAAQSNIAGRLEKPYSTRSLQQLLLSLDPPRS